MKLKIPVFLSFLFAVFVKADDLQCTGCLCATADNSALFARGDSATLCIHFITVDKTSGEIVTQRAAYPVVVDTFSSVQLQGAQPIFQQYDFVGIVAQAHGTVMSLPLTYQQTAQSFYSSAFSLVIQIDGGSIQSVLWDHRCATCSSDACYKFSTTGGTLVDAICNNPDCLTSVDSSCDPQVYVTWVGSDTNGVKMTSAGMRLSRFQQFSSSDLLGANTISRYTMPISDDSDSTGTENSTNSTQGGTETNGGTNNSSTPSEGNGTTPEPNNPSTPNEGNGTTTGEDSGTTEGSGNQTNPETNNPSTPSEGNGTTPEPNNPSTPNEGNGTTTGEDSGTTEGSGNQTNPETNNPSTPSEGNGTTPEPNNPSTPSEGNGTTTGEDSGTTEGSGNQTNPETNNPSTPNEGSGNQTNPDQTSTDGPSGGENNQTGSDSSPSSPAEGEESSTPAGDEPSTTPVGDEVSSNPTVIAT